MGPVDQIFAIKKVVCYSMQEEEACHAMEGTGLGQDTEGETGELGPEPSLCFLGEGMGKIG